MFNKIKKIINLSYVSEGYGDRSLKLFFKKSNINIFTPVKNLSLLEIVVLMKLTTKKSVRINVLGYKRLYLKMLN
jgi:hypothetical protein